MNNLIFSLNATLPIFIIMILGYFLNRINMVSQDFAGKLNGFVFKIALPIQLFHQLYYVDIFNVWDTKYVAYCFIATFASIVIAILVSFLLRDKSMRGEFVQSSYRSSASLLGLTYIQNIYGTATLGSLMILGAVPLYNVMAVVVLTFMHPNPDSINNKESVAKQAIVGIIKNPIIWGIGLGLLWSILKIPMPEIGETSLSYISRCASPLGLLAMGATLNLSSITKKLGPILLSSALKLIGFVALFIPVAIALGFRDEKLVAVLIMLGSASTVSGFVMAKNMGYDGNLSSGAVALTTLLSSFSLAFWLWLLKGMALI